MPSLMNSPIKLISTPKMLIGISQALNIGIKIAMLNKSLNILLRIPRKAIVAP